MSRFNIDFFEFSFLVEACIPPRPIARAMFWDDLINKHYHVLTQEERGALYTWITTNSRFDFKNEDCSLFASRYNPENQFKIKVALPGAQPEIECFMHAGRFYKGTNVSINPDYITEVNKIKAA